MLNVFIPVHSLKECKDVFREAPNEDNTFYCTRYQMECTLKGCLHTPSVCFKTEVYFGLNSGSSHCGLNLVTSLQ